MTTEISVMYGSEKVKLFQHWLNPYSTDVNYRYILYFYWHLYIQFLKVE